MMGWGVILGIRKVFLLRGYLYRDLNEVKELIRQIFGRRVFQVQGIVIGRCKDFVFYFTQMGNFSSGLNRVVVLFDFCL